MSYSLKRSVFVFVIIYAIGAFCALVAGIEWGTFEAGLVALFTLIPALIVAAVAHAGVL